ncbi:MAG: hypothetical protein GC185_06875 [Alphaproteobacteria bacterium]|nr:hypothetical protein [Alphaproteobacteria bacterium]
MAEFDREALADKLVSSLKSAQSPAAVDALFAQLRPLPEKDFAFVLDAVEKKVVDSLLADFNDSDMNEIKAVVSLIESAQGSLQGQFLRAQFEAEVSDGAADLAISQVFLRLSELKGEAASPFVKTYVAEAAKLSDKEYNSAFGQFSLMLRVAERAGVGGIVPQRSNPFRKGGNAP